MRFLKPRRWLLLLQRSVLTGLKQTRTMTSMNTSHFVNFVPFGQAWFDYRTLMNKEKPNLWLNIYLMAGPFLLTVISTLLTGLPLMGLFVIPGTFVSLVMWLKSPSTPVKQQWRSLFLGCLFSYIFLGVLSTQWP